MGSPVYWGAIGQSQAELKEISMTMTAFGTSKNHIPQT